MKHLRRAAMLIAASAMAALPASAAPPAAARATVDLHIDAVGIAPPDFAVAPVTLNGSGTSREAAEGQLAERRDSLQKTLAGQGVAAGKIKLGAVTATEEDLVCYESTCTGDDGVVVPLAEVPEEAFLSDDEVAAAATEAAYDGGCKNCAVTVPVDAASEYAADAYGMHRARLWIASAEGTVQVDDIARLADALTAISAVGKVNAGLVRYEFIDRAQSRKAALADGLKQARAQAEAYAASIGCRVLRIKGLSNTAAPFSVTDIFTMMSRTEGPGKDNKFMQSEFAPVGVDFVLVAL